MSLIPVQLGFDVADAEDLRFSFNDGAVSASFKDWREERVQLVCMDALAVRWQAGELSLQAKERDDASYEVEDSPWLGQFSEQARNAKDVSPLQDDF